MKEEDSLLFLRKNPRNLGFLQKQPHGNGGGGGSRITNKKNSMSTELISKLPSPILDRFRVLVNKREEELRVEDDDLMISKEDIARIYDFLLSELTFNSKPIIRDLTIIAGEQSECAAAIVDVICNRIIEVSAEQKLPCLYLVDNIVKNNENVYLKYFASRIHEVFCEAYKQVYPDQHHDMQHLFGTWSANSAVFPPSILRQIASELQFSALINHRSLGSTALSSSETMSPRPDHGIHVNTKYLEARCQFEHATVDVQHGRYDKIDVSHSEIFSSHVRPRNINSFRIEACTSSIRGTERIHPSKKWHSNPSRLMPAGSLSPSGDGFVIDNSPGRASPSHCGLEYGPDRVSERGGKRSDWWMKHRLDNNCERVETSTTYNPGDGDNQQKVRALIDAYGHYGGKNCLNDKSLKVERLDVNSINSEANTRSWQNTEEEEYVWEDMSPTLADHRSNGSILSNPPLGGLMTITGLGRSACALAKPDLRRDNWPRQGMLSVVDDSAIIAEDGLSILGPGRGSIGKEAVDGPQTQQKATQIQGSPYWQELWNLPSHSSPAFQQLNREESGRVVQMPFRATGTAPSVSQRLLSLIDNTSNQRQAAQLQSEFLKPQGGREGFIPSIPAQLSSHLVAPPLSHGHTPQGFGAAPVTNSLKHIPGLPLSATTVRTIPITSFFQSSVGSLSPLPPGSSPSLSHMQSTSHIMGSNASQPQSSGLSELISSLMAQGLISLTTNPVQGSDLLEFDPEALKVRHESAIAAIYDDLPRQCTTCGLRFKGQEEHSNHMDWHVTRNRTSRKQKGSRKPFVSSNLWLSSLAGAGTDLLGLLPTEAVVEKKSDEEMAVLADEDQNTCALCGESFDDFYSDDTEEWMYRGAVYMNALDGSTEGVDRSLLGPIVHVKCRSGSSVTTLEGFAQNETGMSYEGSQRKRMRV